MMVALTVTTSAADGGGNGSGDDSGSDGGGGMSVLSTNIIMSIKCKIVNENKCYLFSK